MISSLQAAAELVDGVVAAAYERTAAFLSTPVNRARAVERQSCHAASRELSADGKTRVVHVEFETEFAAAVSQELEAKSEVQLELELPMSQVLSVVLVHWHAT